MLRIGLTGGIGSGKSTVCQMFAELGIPVIDTDAIAHQLVAPGQPALKQLTSAFGPDILDQEGQLDRALLRERVFGDAEKRHQLEAIMHPLIRLQMQEQLKALNAAYVIIAIPLLLEKGWQSEVNRILVVDVDEALQVERTVKRDNITIDIARQIMRAQLPRQQRLEAADDIIHNEGDSTALRAQVENLHMRYLQLAEAT